MGDQLLLSPIFRFGQSKPDRAPVRRHDATAAAREQL
jgi:hypothetical protein